MLVDPSGAPIKAPLLLDDDELYIVVRVLGLDLREPGKRNYFNFGPLIGNPKAQLIAGMEKRGLVQCEVNGAKAIKTVRKSKVAKIAGRNRRIHYTEKKADRRKIDLCVGMTKYGIESAKHTFNDRKRTAADPVPVA